MRAFPVLLCLVVAVFAGVEAQAQAPAPLAISLARGWEDHRTLDLVTAIRTAAPAVNVTIVPVDQQGSVPVVLGIPQPYRRFHFFMPIGQPQHHRDRSTRFAKFLLRCDVRREDLCAGKLLARLDRRFRQRG